MLFRCSDSTITRKAECEGVYVDPVTGAEKEREWHNPEWGSFDNLSAALLALYPAVAMTGWQDAMYDTTAIQGPDLGPLRNVAPANAIYFVVFIIAGTWFTRSLFIGAVLETFLTLQRKARHAGLLLTEEQQQRVYMQRYLIKAKPTFLYIIPTNPYREMIFRVVIHVAFAYFMLAIIIANIIVMAMEYYPQSDAYGFAINVANAVFMGVFFVEMTLKLIALGGRYFRDPWNVLDFFIVWAAIADVIVTFGVPGANSFSTSVFRTLRVLRVLKLFKFSVRLQTMVTTIVISMPSVANILLIFLCVMFIYACMGVGLFGEAEYGVYYRPPHTFTNFGTALFVLFRVTIGGYWERMAYELAENYPGVHAYFYTYSLITEMVLLDLIVAILLETFNQTFLVDKGRCQVRRWSTLCRHGPSLTPRETCTSRYTSWKSFCRTSRRHWGQAGCRPP